MDSKTRNNIIKVEKLSLAQKGGYLGLNNLNPKFKVRFLNNSRSRQERVEHRKQQVSFSVGRSALYNGLGDEV